MMKKGFDRLRGVAAASAMGLGLIGGSARAADTNIPLSKLTRGSAQWEQIKNTISLLAISSSTATTLNGIAITTSQSGFAINDVKFTTGMDNAFDAALFMSSGTTVFKNPDSTVDLSGDTLKSDLVSNFVTNIDAQIEFYFHPTRPLVRALYNFTNTSGSDKTLSNILIGGNLGSDSTTLIQSTSDNDTTLENSDLWFITSNTNLGVDPDPSNTTDTPVVTISRNGSGAASTPINGFSVGGTVDSFANNYTITVPANSTARIMVFAEINKSITDAETCAKDFETLDDASNAGLLTGLTTQLNEIVNYAAATGTTTTSTCTHTNGSDSGSGGGSDEDDGDKSTGTLSISITTTLLGLLTLSRIRRKKI